MSRLQLALNVENLEASIAFFSQVFATEPYKVRPGYANWEIADPPLKLVIFEAAGQGGTINHLGVETDDAEEVAAADGRFQALGITTTGVDDSTCCYAQKTETWISDPDGTRWEWYVKLADAVSFGRAPGATGSPGSPDTPAAPGSSACCA